MKIRTLLEARHDSWAKELAAQNRARIKAEKEQQKKLADLEKAASKPVRAPKKPKIDSHEIFMKVQDAIGNSFPDGDPIDHLSKYLDRTGLTMDDINAAVKKHAGKGKKKYGMYEYLSDMWEDTQGDALHDAKELLAMKSFQLFDNSVFYYVEGGPGWGENSKTWDGWDDVVIVPTRNPWR